jgi:hypothetical protein
VLGAGVAAVLASLNVVQLDRIPEIDLPGRRRRSEMLIESALSWLQTLHPTLLGAIGIVIALAAVLWIVTTLFERYSLVEWRLLGTSMSDRLSARWSTRGNIKAPEPSGHARRDQPPVQPS